MSFVLLLLLSMTVLTQVELRNADIGRQQLLARENARLGLMIALGNLQKHAGPDQRVTARAEGFSSTTPESSVWTGVWDASNGAPSNPVWLVSGTNPDPVNGPQGANPATLFEATPDIAAVRAEWMPILDRSGYESGKYAYWVEEQSVKARINMEAHTRQLSYLDPDETQDMGESMSLFPSADKIFNELRTSSQEDVIPLATVEQLARVTSNEQVGITLPASTDPDRLIAENRHSYSVTAANVLENSVHGGLKTNLTGINQSGLDVVLNRAANRDDDYLKGDFLLYHNINPSSGDLFPETVDPNNTSPTGGSITARKELARVPAADFFDFRNNHTDPNDGETEVVRNIMPVITEASFRLGAFHQHGGNNLKHRIRFHADVEFWNPYPFPIRFASEGQSRVFSVMLLPTQMGGGRGRDAIEREKMILSVQKMAAGRGRGGSTIEEEFHTDLFNFDERYHESFSGSSFDRGDNTLDETVMITWLEIGSVTLQPGEVYHATTGLERGLARILGGYIRTPGGDRGDQADYMRDPVGTYVKWSWDDPEDPTHPVLNPDDRVNIDLRMPPSGLTFRIIDFDTRSRSDSPVYEDNGSNEWAKPIFEIRHLYKGIGNPPTLTLRGDEYSRWSSGSYTENDFNIGFHFRLDDEAITLSNGDASTLTKGFDLRQPVWDYDNPAVRDLVMVGGVYPEDAAAGVDPNPFDTNALGNLFFDGLDIFSDDNSDSHGGTYQQAFLYHKPIGEPLTVGSFRRLPLTYENTNYDIDGDGSDESVQLKVGEPWGGDFNQAFDKYFYTGTPSFGLANSDALLPLPAEVRNNASIRDLRSTDAAKNLLLKGGFNINSISGPAWAAILSRSIHDWSYDAVNTVDLSNAFLNLAQSTDNAIAAVGGLSDDSSLTTIDPTDLSAPEKAGRLAMRYPLRRLTDEQIYNPDTVPDDSLVEFIITELRNHLSTNPPFATVSEFINSGILERAIRSSKVNGSLPKFSPAYLTQGSILEAISPFLTVRSDTFVIRSIGSNANPITGAPQSTILCEAVVQRVPDRMDGDALRINETATSNGNTFGRQFVILDFSWREAIQ